MRSRLELLRCLVLAAASAAPPALADDVAPPASAPIGAEQVKRVVAEMKADPVLNGQHTEHQLRWKNLARDKPEGGNAPHWLVQVVRWIADAGRAAVWVLGAIAAALIVVFAWRWASVRSDALRARAEMLPSHVNELDIRPQSLPADIAAAARTLHLRGELRATLSLLYRGALSRLVHSHGVPIRAASTEGECVRLASAVLPAAGTAYFERLVAAWQTEVYAGRAAHASTVAALCDAFDAHFVALPASAMPAAIASA